MSRPSEEAAVAQVGAILILAKPENREKLIYLQILPFGGVHDAVPDKIGERLLVRMLQLASTTSPEMAARRVDVMRTTT